MPLASGVFKQLTYKLESTYGVVPSAASAQSLRRVTSDISLNKDVYSSAEIRPDQQMQDMRHGVRRVAGTINGELSPGTYKDFMAAALRRDFTTLAAITGASITIAGTGPTWTVTRAAGSFLTDGIKRGHVVRLSVGSFNVANANKNLVVSGVTATVLTVRPLNGVALVAEGPVTGATVTMFGRQTWVPQTGHTNQSFSVEHWFPDVPASEVYAGCQPTQLDLQMPPTGLATLGIGMVGRDVVTAASQYFTSPTAATTTGLTAAVNGVLLVGGVALAIVTGLSLSIQSGRSGEPVVGSNNIPTQFPGRVLVSGQVTAYFDDVSLRDAFLNETEAEVIVVLSSDNTAASKFISFTLPRCKFGGAAKSDGEAGIVQTIPFTALLPTTGGSGIANELSTIVVQDSDA